MLCHVLGQEGLAFTELAIDQRLLVFDLGGGTLDLAVVQYRTNEVRVVSLTVIWNWAVWILQRFSWMPPPKHLSRNLAVIRVLIAAVSSF